MQRQREWRVGQRRDGQQRTVGCGKHLRGQGRAGREGGWAGAVCFDKSQS
jgi:hypothetical protein